MKKPVLILLNLTALMIGACASQKPTTTQPQVATASSVPVAAKPMSPSEEYRSYVEKHARAVHAELHWYHIPDDDDVDKSGSWTKQATQ